MSKFDEFIICRPFAKVKAFEVHVSEENLNYILLLKKGITVHVLGNVKVSSLRELFTFSWQTGQKPLQKQTKESTSLETSFLPMNWSDSWKHSG